MDFSLTKEQIRIQKNVREFMRKEVAPVAEEIDLTDAFPKGIWKRLGAIGLLGLSLPEEFGGSGYDTLTFALAVEEMAKVCPGMAMSYVAHSNLCAHNLERNGTLAQKQKFLPGLCSGDLIGCMGLTEPVKAKLANMYTETEAAKGLVYRSAILADSSKDGGKGTEVHKLAAAAILFAAEAASRAANESLQIHGGYGYTLDYPINRLYRDAKLFEIGAGTSEIRRLVIADELIKKKF